MPRMKGDNNEILGWWKENEAGFPLLSPVAKYVLAISASSATSERVFSSGGRTVTTSRSNLDGEKVEDLVFLSLNLPVLKHLKILSNVLISSKNRKFMVIYILLASILEFFY